VFDNVPAPQANSDAAALKAVHLVATGETRV